MRHRSEKNIYTILNTQISPFRSDCINEVLCYYARPFIKTSFLKYARHPPLGPLGFPCFLLGSMVNEVWLHVFKAEFCFEIMHLRELLGRNILGSLDTMSQEKFEFIGLLSFVLLKILAIHEKSL